MNILQALKTNYPQLQQGKDYWVFTEQGVQKLAKWNAIGIPCPTEEQLAAWVAEPYVAPAPVPIEVGSGQIRAALIAKGVAADDDALTATIEAAITAAVSDPAQRAIAITLWRNASTFKRAHAFVAVVKGALNKDDAWVDDLFRMAAAF